MDPVGSVKAVVHRASLEAQAFAVLRRAGMFGVESPGRMIEILGAMRAYGPFGAAPRVAALRHGDRPAIADERGEIGYTEFDERVRRLSNALKGERLAAGARIGILCRNHRQPLITAFAASQSGMNAIWLNTARASNAVG